jgi:Tol biopolymer transport system component
LAKEIWLGYGGTNPIVNQLSWSPDGQYLAVAASPDNSSVGEMKIYSFDGTNLNLVVSSTELSNVEDVCISWSPDGRYIAVGSVGNGSYLSDFYIYRFDGNILTDVSHGGWDLVQFPARVSKVRWSPNGKYIGVGAYYLGAGAEFNVYSFANETLQLIGSDTSYTYSAEEMAWSPDGRYIAIGKLKDPSGAEVKLYKLENGVLTAIPSGDINLDATINALSFSPDGKYLFVGASGYPTVNGRIHVYKFDGLSFTNVYTEPSSGWFPVVHDFGFTSDGDYVAVSLDGYNGEGLRVYKLQYNYLFPQATFQDGGISLNEDMNLNTNFEWVLK